MCEFSPKRFVNILENKVPPNPFGNAGNDTFVKEYPHLCFREISDGDYLLFYLLRKKSISNISRRKKKKRIDLAMLHDVELPQPGLIERIAGSVYNMAKSILFCKDQHRVQKAFHCFSGLNKSGTCIMNDKQFEKNE